MLNSVRQDWNKIVVAIAVAESLCKIWDKAIPFIWSHSVQTGTALLFFLSLPSYLFFSLHQTAMDHQVDILGMEKHQAQPSFFLQ